MATTAPVVIGTNDNTTVTTPPVDPTAGATSTDTTQVASTVATSQAQTTSEASTVAQTVTAPVTIVNNTTDAVTNASATTDAVTTASATTDVVTTASATTDVVTTASATTDAVTTASATTAATTTVGPTTTGPTTVSPSTAVPTYTTATTEPPTSQSVKTVTSSPFIGSSVSETTQIRANSTTTGTLITSAPATILGLEPWLFILIIGAALFLIIAIGMLVYCLVKRKKRKAARIAERSSPWIHTERTDDIRLQRINKSDDPWRKSDSVEDKKTMYGVNNTTVNVFDNDNQAFDSSPILRLATRTKDRNSSERDTSSINSSTPSRTTSPKPKALTKVSVPVIGEKSTSVSDAKEKDDKEENEEEGDDSSLFSLKSDEPGLSASMNSFKSPASTPSTSPWHKIESSSAAPSSGKATPDSRPKKGVAATTPVVPGSTSPLKPNDQSNSSIPPPPVSGGIPPPPSVPTSIPAPPSDEKSPIILPPPPPPPPPDANGQVRDATGAIVNNDEINDRQSSFLHNK